MSKIIVIMGGGPNGLNVAINAKLFDPDAEIYVYEQYTEFKRKHLLFLNKESFIHAHPDPAFQKRINSFPTAVKTNDLQQAFLDYAKQLGIHIVYKTIASCEQLRQAHSDATIFVDCGGSHSILHKEIFNDEFQTKETMQYAAEVKYEVEAKHAH